MSKNHIKVNSIAKHRTIVSRALDELGIATEQLRHAIQSATRPDHIAAAENTAMCAQQGCTCHATTARLFVATCEQSDTHEYTCRQRLRGRRDGLH